MPRVLAMLVLAACGSPGGGASGAGGRPSERLGEPAPAGPAAPAVVGRRIEHWDRAVDLVPYQTGPTLAGHVTAVLYASMPQPWGETMDWGGPYHDANRTEYRLSVDRKSWCPIYFPSAGEGFNFLKKTDEPLAFEAIRTPRGCYAMGWSTQRVRGPRLARGAQIQVGYDTTTGALNLQCPTTSPVKADEAEILYRVSGRLHSLRVHYDWVQGGPCMAP